ncbi:MAG: sigma-70 family RNA polymerase sigma factor [Synechococcus sp.]
MAMRTTTARDRRVKASLDLVTPIALHYARTTNQDKDDLIQVGRLGLIKAAALYESSRAIPFSAYARPHIRGAILHYLRDSVGLVRLPRRVQERAQRLLKQSSSEASPSPVETSAPDQQILEDYRHRGGWQLLIENQQGHSQHPDAWGCHHLADQERRDVLSRCWQSLPVMEQRCLQAVVLEGQSLRATGKTLGTSAMTVQRRVKSALSSLARGCRAEGVTGVMGVH